MSQRVSMSKKHTKSKQNKTKKVNHTIKPPFPIDVVYTWKGEDFSDNIRYSYNYELKYSLRSVFFFAPWVNKIYILMNKAKQPSWIKENDKIIILEHSQTFPLKDYLPNYNSNAIETTVANIPGLSEHYIYFNDDIFLGRKTSYTDFFTSSGKAIVDINTLFNKNTLKNKKDNILDIKFPPNTYRIYKHIPIPQIKSLVLEFNKKYADYIHWIRSTKKRKLVGFGMCTKYHLNKPCQQIHYPIAKYMYSKHKAVLKNADDMYIGNTSEDFNYKLKEILYRKPLFFCINDRETNLSKKKIMLKLLVSFFNKYYPKKADFEV